MKGKYIIGGVSVILVVAVCIGLIAGVNKASSSSSSKDGDNVLSTTTKPVAIICSQTEHKQECVKSLNSISNNQSATPQDLIQAAVQATIQDMKAALGNSSSVLKQIEDSFDKKVTEDCQEMLHYAIYDLEDASSMVGNTKLDNLSDVRLELNNYMSNVVTYIDTCLDAYSRPEFKQAMSDVLHSASQLSDNALAIVTRVSDILTAFNIPVNASSSRRLLQASELGHDGFPEWMSGGDRKLLQVANNQIRPNAVVAKDGSGQYKTIKEALAAYPKNNKGRYSIYIKAGVYNEQLLITKEMNNVFMYGDGPRKTIITGNDNVAIKKSPTWRTATVAVVGNGFIAKGIQFQNTAGPKGEQAVALRISGDMATVYNCKMDGYQDTLYYQNGRQFYSKCAITGTVDFIFGNGNAIIQDSVIIVRKPEQGQKNTVTASGRDTLDELRALVLQNCRIVPEKRLFPVRFAVQTYLGRPWKQYSTAIIMESELGDFIQPGGWLQWDGKLEYSNTCIFAEYANRGPGANTAKRVNWKGFKMIDRNEALKYTVNNLIKGNEWLQNTGALFYPSLRT